MSAGADLRAEAAGMLAAVIFDGRSLKSVLAQVLPLWPDTRDRALLEAICFAALRHRRRYEFALSRWMESPLSPRDTQIHTLLLAGLAQIEALGLSAHAAVATTAEAARLLGRPALVALVNALLRRALREGLPHTDETAIASSHPDWLVEQFQSDWPDDLETLLRENNQPAPLWLRANAPRASRDRLMQSLLAQSLAPQAADIPRDGVRLEKRVAPMHLSGWNEGVFTVQDGAAQLAVEALAPQADEHLLDACAAPGGKTAQLLASGGNVVALDIDASRLRKVADTIQRLALPSSQLRLLCADAADVPSWWGGEYFDGILIDAPCSATGIIRRQPDIKWHRRPEDIPALLAQQSRLLDALWPLLALGGRLLYATCSVLKSENEHQVAAFLERTPQMQAQALDARYGRASGVGRQRLPGENGMDGFFYALMARVG